MRIVIDARRLHASTGRYMRNLLNELQQLKTDGHTFHVIIHETDQGVWAPHADNFIMHVVDWDHYTLGEQFGFAKYLYRLKPDLVHFTMPMQPLLYFGKRVTTFHDLTQVYFTNNPSIIYRVKQKLLKLLFKNVAKRSIIITPTKFTRKQVVEFASIPEDQITVTYEAAEEISTIKKEPLPAVKNKDFLLYVGNAFPYKNVQFLVDVFAQLKEKYPKLHLVLAGKKDMHYEAIETYVSEKQVSDVHIPGFISDGELSWLYSHAKVYVFPSLNEGFGLPGLEAMQHDLPVASSNASCLPEVYRDGALYFDPSNTDEAVEVIHRLLKSKKRREDQIKAGSKVVNGYSWQRMAKQTLDVYTKSD